MTDTPVRNTMSGDTLRRHQAFWNREQMDRMSWGVSVGFFANEVYPRVMANLPAGPVKPENFSIKDLLRDCDERWEAQRGLGDFPYTCAPISSVPWLEAIAGCPIIASPTSIWAEPCVSDWSSWDWKQPVLANPWARRLLEITQALVEHSQGRYQVSPTLMRGPADIAAAVRGAAQFPMDFLDAPELVRPALRECAGIWREVAQAQLDLLPPSPEGYVALDAALRAWAPDKLLWLQEDAMALLSPSLYRDFVLPLDHELSASFPCVAFHLHGTALWAIDELVQIPGIKILELNLEDARCDVEGTFAGWKKIQAHKPLVIWRAYRDDFSPWLGRIRREFPVRGLALQVSVHNLEEARKVQNEFSKYESR